MEKFTASNGVPVRRTAKGYLSFTRSSDFDLGTITGISTEQEEALREFFQAERDEELGRWRWPENPNFVVYPDEDGDVAVLNERDGMSGIGQTRATVDRYPNSFGADAARAYFESHPERKPWHDANRDEVWLFKSEGRGHALAWRAEDGWDVIDQRGNYHKGIEDVPAEMVAHSFYGWENATAVRLLPEAS